MLNGLRSIHSLNNQITNEDIKWIRIDKNIGNAINTMIKIKLVVYSSAARQQLMTEMRFQSQQPSFYGLMN